MKQNVIMILASNSPRRKELLEQAGLEFEVIPSDAEEIITSDLPQEVVLELSRQKSTAVADKFIEYPPQYLETLIDPEKGGVMVIGADTVVAYEGKILGKPKNGKDAANMLNMLSGNTHEVYSGVTCKVLQFDDKRTKLIETDSFSFYEKTFVNMYPFDTFEAIDYISTGEPMDKAGAYGIQGIGQRLVESIKGDYNNVVGFPLSRFMKELSERDYISYI